MQRPGIGLAGRIAAALVAVLLLPSVARSQAAAPSPSPSPWGLFSARYDTRTSDFIYAVYGVGNTFGMVGVLHNPRSDYSEVLGGVGRNFRIAAGPTQTVALGVADASDAWYAQVYVLPALRRGPLWVRATSELYLPLERSGTVQFSVSPVSATLALSHLVEAGVSLDLSVAQNAAASTAAGPEIRVALPKAVLGADLQKDLGHAGGRFRMFFLGSF